MDLGLSDEQRMLQEMVRDVCTDRFPLEALRRLESDEDGLDRGFWNSLIELGLPGIAVAERHGGHGLGLLECALVHEQFGYHLAQSPHLASSLLAAAFIEEAADKVLSDALLPGIADGSRLVSIAWAEPHRGDGVDKLCASATPDGNGFRLSGSKHFVPFASVAHDIIVLCRGADKDDLAAFAVSCEDDGVTWRRQQTMAEEPYFTMDFDNVPVPQGRAFGAGEDVRSAWQSAQARAMVCIAASATGAARRIHEISTAYAKEREAFGKPIGAFQAIAHYLADAIVEIEGSATLVRHAAWVCDQGRPFALDAAVAKLQACDTFRRASALGIQVHGGLGYTVEADPQLFFRRAKQWQVLNGGRPWLIDEIARLSEPAEKPGV